MASRPNSLCHGDFDQHPNQKRFSIPAHITPKTGKRDPIFSEDILRKEHTKYHRRGAKAVDGTKSDSSVFIEPRKNIALPLNMDTENRIQTSPNEKSRNTRDLNDYNEFF
jgi:hypothetical protein